jgi:hypothetical protein
MQWFLSFVKTLFIPKHSNHIISTKLPDLADYSLCTLRTNLGFRNIQVSKYFDVRLQRVQRDKSPQPNYLQPQPNYKSVDMHQEVVLVLLDLSAASV